MYVYMYNWITKKNNSIFWNLIMVIFLPVFLNVLWTPNNKIWQNFKYICVGYEININRNNNVIFKLLMTSFKMLLFLFFPHLIKYSQKNVIMSHYDCIFFSFSLIFLLIFALWILVSLLLGVWWFMMSIFIVNCTFHHYKYSSLFQK